MAQRPDRPPYRVPSMAEIEATPPNGLVVASTFSGAGGSCLGYRMAGFRVAWASEFEPHAAATYAANSPSTVLDTRDVREVRGEEILEAVGGEVDLFDGSPPCQSFSTAGKRHKGWGKVADHADGTRQRSDDLFDEYARILGEPRPRAFVAENVAGLARGVAVGYFKEVMRALAGKGYRVEARLLDASWLGVPQVRKRVIIQGVRDDLEGAPAWPAPWPFRYSLGDACPWLASMRWDPRGQFNPQDFDPDDVPSTVAAGGAGQWKVTELAFHSGGWNDGKRRSADLPAPCVQAGGLDGGGHGQVSLSGDGRRRRLEIPELKRICSFPDDFAMEGGYQQQWARLGNSVPPLMMRAVASAVRDGPLAAFTRAGS